MISLQVGEWSRQEEEMGGEVGGRPRVLSRSIKAGYQHSIAHTVATELAMVRENRRAASARSRALDRERMSLATRFCMGEIETDNDGEFSSDR